MNGIVTSMFKVSTGTFDGAKLLDNPTNMIDPTKVPVPTCGGHSTYPSFPPCAGLSFVFPAIFCFIFKLLNI